MENTLVDEAKSIYDKLGITYLNEELKFEEIAQQYSWPYFHLYYPYTNNLSTGSSNSSCYSINEMNNAQLERNSFRNSKNRKST